MKYFVTGDIHGEFTLLFKYIIINKISDAKIIVAGDCGFGFEKLKFYTYIFKYVNEYLVRLNTFVLFVRGNHDDPDYFSADIITAYSNIKLLKDYSVVDDKILVIGGGVSIDKLYRIKDITWWEHEDIVRVDINSIQKVDVVVSHECPDVVEIQKNFGEIPPRKTIVKSMKEGRKYLTDVYRWVSPKCWYFGHYHIDFNQKYEDCEFQCCRAIAFEGEFVKLYEIK